ncbi:MAG: FAD-binding oxidoreductase [Candidatus Bathyarchaeia archaeon]
MNVSLVKDLREIIGDDDVATEPADLLQYAKDRTHLEISHGHRGKPDAVVRPESTEEVVEIVTLANKHRIPIIPRGGGTNFVGAAIPTTGGIVLDMKKMNKVLEIDKDSLIVRAQPGITLASLDQELEKYGLVLGHQPGSYPSATVGGTISTDAFGIYRAGKYGTIRDMVLGLEVVLPTSETLRIKPIPKSSAGYNLKYLFIGAEGTLGIITEADLRLSPLPEKVAYRVFEFKTFADGFEAAKNVIMKGVEPSLEFVKDRFRSREYGEHLGRSLEATVSIYFEGLKEEVELKDRIASDTLRKNGGVELPDELSQFAFATRESTYVTASKQKAYDIAEFSLPASRVLKLCENCRRIFKTYGLEAGYGVLLHKNYYVNFGVEVFFDEQNPEEVRKYVEMDRELRKAAIDVDGTQTYCHGIGVKNTDLIERELGFGLNVMKAIKRTMDPNNIMNPGKKGLS